MKKVVFTLSLLLFLGYLDCTEAISGSLFETNIDKSLKAAKLNKKPVLIDFYGIWCPPCNELDETVFETSAFLQKAKGFNLLKVDADKTESWNLKHKYKIGGYPTLLFTDSQGEELYRIVGYRSLSEITRVMDMVQKAKGKNFAKACSSNDPEDLWRCITICGERKDSSCVDKTMKTLEPKLTKGSPRYLLAWTYALDYSQNEDLKRDGYERMMNEYPQSIIALAWATEYLKLFEKNKKLTPKKELIEKVLTQAKVEGDPTELGFTVTDVPQVKATLLEELGKKEEAKKYWKESAVELGKLAKSLPTGVTARGFALEQISSLESAGESEAALSLANEYRLKYPNEFTFNYIVATLLNSQKKYNEALPIAQLAFDHSYGDNKIRSAILLVKLHGVNSNKEAAKKVYESVTQEIKPDEKMEVRTHRYLKKLAETFKTIS
jgi:thiol-disulfide isomerase/thioredoxin